MCQQVESSLVPLLAKTVFGFILKKKFPTVFQSVFSLFFCSIQSSWCTSNCIPSGPEYKQKVKLEEQLRTVEETVKNKRKLIRELQQDIQVSATSRAFKGC